MQTLLVVVAAAALLAANATANGHVTALKDTTLRTCAPMASYRALNIARYQPACVISLTHRNEGVVESALRDAMLLKLARPDLDLPAIKEEIDNLAIEGATPVIRFKAALAKQVYENPGMFALVARAEYITADDAFAAVADQLERSLLVVRK
jgi:hypothetical protein